MTTQTGYGIAGTFNETVRTDEDYEGTWLPPGWLPDFRDLYARGLNESEMDEALRRRGLLRARIEATSWRRAAGTRSGCSTSTGWDSQRVAGQILGISKNATLAQMISFWLIGLLALLSLATKARGLARGVVLADRAAAGGERRC